MNQFQAFGLPQPLMHSLAHLQFSTPTPIQAATIPIALEGSDILGSAQTGTGKTAAFGIPLIAKLLSSKRGSAIVITPTRELATQVMKALQDLLGSESPIKSALLIGGESIPKQIKQLSMRPRLFVGTPGRINDLLSRGKLNLHDANFLVLDETDRMLDMGFSVQIDKILNYLPKQRQTLLFSATLPKNIMTLTKAYLTDPKRVAIGSTTNPAAKINHQILKMEEGAKYPQLIEQIEQRPGSIIVFVKTKFGAEKMAKRLRRDKHDTEAIHGDLRHSKREKVIRAFRQQKYRILVATDIAARGLDIPHIEHVINYDLPQCPEDYIHRIGRTARAGAKGDAIGFITPSDGRKWHAIELLIDPENAKKQVAKPSNKPKKRLDQKFGKKKSPNVKRGKRPAKNFTRSKAKAS